MKSNFWSDVKPGMTEDNKDKRANNRESSAEILFKKGITFECKNNGAHLVVRGSGCVVDFWPGTGLYIVRVSEKKGRGVFNLLKFLKEKTGEQK